MARSATRLEYSGGPTGTLKIFHQGREVWSGLANSGRTGHHEWEEGHGPIPGVRKYWVYNKIARPRELKVSVSGQYVATASGIQDVPPALESVWGKKRLRVEGYVRVSDPIIGTSVRRGNFYIHGGSPLTPSSSGCIKVPAIDLDGFFTEFTKLPKNVRIPLYVD